MDKDEQRKRSQKGVDSRIHCGSAMRSVFALPRFLLAIALWELFRHQGLAATNQFVAAATPIQDDARGRTQLTAFQIAKSPPGLSRPRIFPWRASVECPILRVDFPNPHKS